MIEAQVSNLNKVGLRLMVAKIPAGAVRDEVKGS
jgi:hypothetical protein